MRNARTAAARCLALLLLPVFLLPAAPKKAVATARGENEDLVLTVTLYIDPAGVKELVGSDLDGHYIVADVKVQPKYGKEISIDRDDFQLRTDKDGEKTKPFAPSQIAGSGGLVLKQAPIQRSSPGVTLGGGYPGGYPGGATVGTGGGDDTGDVKATVQNGATEKENPIKKVLEDKVLPEKKTDQPVSGLLYFAMEKQKMKDLELTYGGRENRITMRFK